MINTRVCNSKNLDTNLPAGRKVSPIYTNIKLVENAQILSNDNILAILFIEICANSCN